MIEPSESSAHGRKWLEVATNIQNAIDTVGLSRPASVHVDANEPSLLARFDNLVTAPELQSVSRKLFADGHYAQAVAQSLICLNNNVKEKSELADEDGASLMRKAFSANSPVLRINDNSTQSEKDEQLGYMDIFAGAMTGIRNPRVHEHELVDDPDQALELLSLANHLFRKLDGAKK